jgi:hypothetical protein
MMAGDYMKDINIESQEELYARIKPALRSKKRMMRVNGYTSIKEVDIWNYLRLNKWSSSIGLELCDMVDDILHVDEKLVAEYFYTRSVQVKADVEDTMEFMLPKLKS